VVPNPEGYPSPPLHEKEVATDGERYQTPDWVIEGWPEKVTPLANQIYSIFNKKHDTDYKFQLKK
jgi:hypothetical protein